MGNYTEYVGRKIVVDGGDHPYYGEVAEIVSVEWLKFIGKFMIKAKGNYNEFFIEPNDFTFIGEGK